MEGRRRSEERPGGGAARAEESPGGGARLEERCGRRKRWRGGGAAQEGAGAGGRWRERPAKVATDASSPSLYLHPPWRDLDEGGQRGDASHRAEERRKWLASVGSKGAVLPSLDLVIPWLDLAGARWAGDDGMACSGGEATARGGVGVGGGASTLVIFTARSDMHTLCSLLPTVCSPDGGASSWELGSWGME